MSGWEAIAPRSGERHGNGGVTVAWRSTSGRSYLVLVVTIGTIACEPLGLKTGDRIRVERDRMAGKLRLTPGNETGWKPSWRKSPTGCCAVMNVPLDDVTLTERKPAQAVKWDIENGAIVLKLPHWACPIVRVNVPGKAA
jgi:hypothetical protein